MARDGVGQDGTRRGRNERVWCETGWGRGGGVGEAVMAMNWGLGGVGWDGIWEWERDSVSVRGKGNGGWRVGRVALEWVVALCRACGDVRAKGDECGEGLRVATLICLEQCPRGCSQLGEHLGWDGVSEDGMAQGGRGSTVWGVLGGIG